MSATLGPKTLDSNVLEKELPRYKTHSTPAVRNEEKEERGLAGVRARKDSGGERESIGGKAHSDPAAAAAALLGVWRIRNYPGRSRG